MRATVLATEVTIIEDEDHPRRIGEILLESVDRGLAICIRMSEKSVVMCRLRDAQSMRVLAAILNEAAAHGI